MDKPICYIQRGDALIAPALLSGGFVVSTDWGKDALPPRVAGCFAVVLQRSGGAIIYITLYECVQRGDKPVWFLVQVTELKEIESDGCFGSKTYEAIPRRIAVPPRMSAVVTAEMVKE